MRCEEFAEIVHDLACSRLLDELEAAIARAHAESCPACGRRLAEAEELAAILRVAALESRSLEAPGRVESKLVAAFSATNAAHVQRPGRWNPAWRFAFGCAMSVAVVALLVFAWVGHVSNRRSSLAARAGAANAMAAGRKGPVRHAMGQSGSLSAGSGTAMASGFVPVPFSGGFARGDSGVIVRVQVPQAALAELGYPVDEAHGESVVQADLLVGEDGWPRAVRIVK